MSHIRMIPIKLFEIEMIIFWFTNIKIFLKKKHSMIDSTSPEYEDGHEYKIKNKYLMKP